MRSPSVPKKRDLIFAAVLALVCAALWMIPAPARLAAPGGTSAPARVIATDDSELQTHGFVRFGSQKLEVEILSGEFAGKRFPAANELRAQLELDKFFVPGDRITVAVGGRIEPGKSVLTAKDFDRSNWTWGLFGGFCLLLIVFGGWTGAKALFSFVFSCLVIFKAVIPLTLGGYPAIWVIFAAVALLTAVIVFLVAGVTRKGLAAFTGAIAGVLAGLGMAHGFGALMRINGATMPYVQTLLFSGYEKLDIADIFVGALVLASSGAVMDLAMDIASAVEEIAYHNPQLGFRELAASGFRIGRSVVGTMTTTLLLAYSGGYLTLLMMFAAQGTALADILNNPLVAAETVKTLIGSFSLVLVAPLTAVAAGWIFGRRGRPSDGGKPEGISPDRG